MHYGYYYLLTMVYFQVVKFTPNILSDHSNFWCCFDSFQLDNTSQVLENQEKDQIQSTFWWIPSLDAMKKQAKTLKPYLQAAISLKNAKLGDIPRSTIRTMAARDTSHSQGSWLISTLPLRKDKFFWIAFLFLWEHRNLRF